jgi:hypothetical protein
MTCWNWAFGFRQARSGARCSFFFFPLFFFNFNFFIIHMCIQCLGHFSPLPPPTPFHWGSLISMFYIFCQIWGLFSYISLNTFKPHSLYSLQDSDDRSFVTFSRIPEGLFFPPPLLSFLNFLVCFLLIQICHFFFKFYLPYDHSFFSSPLTTDSICF